MDEIRLISLPIKDTCVEYNQVKQKSIDISTESPLNPAPSLVLPPFSQI